MLKRVACHCSQNLSEPDRKPKDTARSVALPSHHTRVKEFQCPFRVLEGLVSLVSLWLPLQIS